MQKIKVIELFAGYGSQHLALKRLKRDYPNFDYEVVAFCEIDKYAIKAYNALHGEHIPNLGDITKVNPVNVPDCDLMTWSFPCTDISSAGAQCGLAEGSNTRSSLCWDAMRIFEVKRPKYLLMENVSALVSQKFLGDFNKLQSDLQNLGYTNFFKLINAKDMGVPQNRLRIFMVSILDCPRAYYFPQPFKLERRLKDVLEHNVEERYYLSDERVAKLMQETAIHSDRGNGFAFRPHTPEEIASTVKCSGIGDKTDNFVAEPKVEIIADLQPDNKRPKSNVVRQQNMIVGVNGLSSCIPATHTKHEFKIAEPQVLGWTRNEKGEITDRHPVNVANCVTANKRDNTQNYVMEPTKRLNITKDGTLELLRGKDGKRITTEVYTPSSAEYAPTILTDNNHCKIYEPTIAAMRGRDKDNPNDRGKSTDNYTQRLELKHDGTSNTLTSFAKDNLLIEPKNINNEQTRVFTDINEANTGEALRLLWQEVGTQTFCEKMGRLGRFQETQVLQQGVHEEGFCENGHDNTEQRHGSQLGETHSVDRGEQGKSVCGVREEGWQTGCASQGRKLEEQFLGEFNDCLSQLPHETPQAEECMRYLRQADGRWTWLLQQTLSTLEEIRQSTDGERKNCQGIRIRRLSERELYRLMDLEEKDIDTLLSTSIPRTQHAKLAGNSIVVACLYYIFRNLFVDTEPAAGVQTKLF